MKNRLLFKLMGVGLLSFFYACSADDATFEGPVVNSLNFKTSTTDK